MHAAMHGASAVCVRQQEHFDRVCLRDLAPCQEQLQILNAAGSTQSDSLAAACEVHLAVLCILAALDH